ncbi:hypothetical protein CPAST_c09470 [Clostridium pasteurianum DSM 525 = ATCC 6013]|jgi:hypothetical protein|uniref:Uncharacterized protein n=1 Tax=Clostridium pasteurianum DSM 525 = ATCC 6013 TaxID=1262449 RepID=A0A0H3J2K3_CLOPA|nr:hypothetical protein [Clostridium pasteurianum]AJA47047.1 hypothetical protein CPAST_c09470 [Clostridium pasteurianum DSM 525 = ATCC 6013]AJA51035.1 hypothetical protein CLPA_c09470 [Clostridium pasteurianum DSM 525 = ATCC 6013]AOZ74415.1 hypothetical protein AQ983_04585 [Clostridium pasteurianum DSM 525 = ATCC 6013]AOZ78212.1 hypothetical protein AQ984_04575 [Clostridium pasteurianum]ELP59565.1 hypothetical protein F502_09788 [Clostridium pasteurianum DSM 525 = ATCC 6013]
MEKENKFIGYEYKNVTVKSDIESLWTDGYKNFGWNLEKSRPTIVKHAWGPIRVMVSPLAIFPGSHFSKMVRDHESETKVDLIFKRDKDIQRKGDLNRLQLQFENSAKEIDRLEKSKSTTAKIVAYSIGIVGTVFMAGSTFSYLAGMLQLCIILAVPGFAAWILSYFLYKTIKINKTKKLASPIEKQYDNVYEICKEANDLI